MLAFLFDSTFETATALPAAQNPASQLSEACAISQSHILWLEKLRGQVSMLSSFATGLAVGVVWLFLYHGDLNDLIAAAMIPLPFSLGFFHARN